MRLFPVEGQKVQEIEYRILLPTYWEMVVTDLLIVLVAAGATGVLLAKRPMLKKARAFKGLSLIVAGLWVHALVYLLDLYAMLLMPAIHGMDPAMRLIQDLHTGYSWYINTLAALLIFAGVIVTALRVVGQIEVVEQSRREKQQSENLLQSIFDNIPVGIIIKNDRHLIESVNTTYLEWYGLEERDLLGQRTNRVRSFKFDAHMRSAQELEEDTLKTGAINTHQIAREFANGEVHFIRVTKFPVFDVNGKIAKVGSASVDMTELLNAKRNAELALEKANAASNAKSRFLATMSHEFRTPLNAIIGYSEMLAMQLFGPLGDKRYENYAKNINDSGLHLLELIDEVLDISSIESEKRSVDLSAVDLSEVLQECRRLLEPQIAEMSITMTTADLDGLPPVFADRRSVKQILLNILSNAVKFNKVNGTVSITARREGDHAAVRVADSGQGISPKVIETITEPFTRGDIDPLVAQPGTGLGLSIVASLVELNHGRLFFESEVGVGTAVTVTLPVAPVAADALV